MTSKRTKAERMAEPPITGVAGGSLGTAANLDDTQVFPTDGLNAAAPAWLDDDAPGVSGEPTAIPPQELAQLHMAPQPNPATGAQPVAVRSSTRTRRSMPALAGVAALLLLLLVAGSGFLSQLDLGLGSGPAGPGAGASAGALIEAQPSATAEPKEAGKGSNGKCHGKGRGNHCGGD